MTVMKIDPWSSATYQDYTRLRDEFGIEEFSENLWKDLPHPHRLLRRNVVFGHRDFSVIHSAILAKKPWAILTGLMPSGRMHLGHKMVIDEVIYYQSIGADIIIAVADIEAFATRGFSLTGTKKLAIEEYITNYIALGLKPENCRIYFQSHNEYVKDLAYQLGKKINWSQMVATYGFNGATNMAHIFSPLVQTGDILHVQLPQYGGVRPTLVPVGVDQDPHLRLSRDVAQAHRLFNIMETKDHRIGVFVKIDTDVGKLLDCAEAVVHDLGFTKLQRITEYKALYLDDSTIEDIPWINEAFAKKEPELGGYGFLQPCSTYHRFMTGLTGDKMSSSKPESAIFLTDSPDNARKKIMHAKTGGAVSIEEQRKQGGSPDTCVVYELFLYHLIENDADLAAIYTSCRKGELMCGQCKKRAADRMAQVLVDLGEKRAKAQDSITDYISDI
ncbi:MAG: tryptophan--tRNA ligase [Candidatus Thermoplasmatota archaeon]|nr:tryptophan--tRNA ligase [Candidatus Thermoplasmatota archaeon]MBU1941418.1 tryptophan--tRNA ligase [Candidatus Thermoplasmatota archaeon]